MRVIGVIDLRGGVAVHARAGRRESYLPVSTAPPSFEPGDAMALATWYAGRGVEEVYVADLDAIGGGAMQRDLIQDLARATNGLWLDAGVTDPGGIGEGRDAGASRIVVGLETLRSFESLEDIHRTADAESVAFSLDLREREPIGRPQVVGDSQAPRMAIRAVESGATAIIVLDVARVGTGRGPDFELLERVRSAVPGVDLIAGGGVRGPEDLARLHSAGCDAVLVASALLDGRLDADDVAALHRRVSR